MNKIEMMISFLKFLLVRKKYLLIPLVVIFLVVGILLVVVQGSVMAPLIYTLF